MEKQTFNSYIATTLRSLFCEVYGFNCH